MVLNTIKYLGVKADSYKFSESLISVAIVKGVMKFRPTPDSKEELLVLEFSICERCILDIPRKSRT